MVHPTSENITKPIPLLGIFPRELQTWPRKSSYTNVGKIVHKSKGGTRANVCQLMNG